MWGHQLPGLVLAFVSQDIMFSLIDFFFVSWLHACSGSWLWPSTEEGEPGLELEAVLPCVHVFGTFVG